MININEINKETLTVEEAEYLYLKGHVISCDNGKVSNINQFGGKLWKKCF